MTIRWDGEAAADVLRQMRSSDAGLGDCLNAARQARQALEEAGSGDDNKVVTMLLSQFDATVTSLEASRRSLEALIGKAESARQRFEDAASQVDRIIAALDVSSAIPPVSGAQAIRGGHAAQASRIEWEVPRPIVIPGLHARTGTVVPEWLEACLNNAELFQEWM